MQTQTMEITKEEISPELATAYLQKDNGSNRKIDPRRVAIYAKDMKNGNWREDTGELLKFTRSGILADGRHRLRGVVVSEKTVSFHVARGIPEDVFPVLDSGKERSSGDMLFISGVKYENIIPSIVNGYYNLMNRTNISGGKSNLSNQEMYTLIKANEEFWTNAAALAVKWYNEIGRIIRPSALGSMYVYFNTVGPNDVMDFMNQLCVDGQATKDVILKMRKILVDNKSAKYTRSRYEIWALLVKTWNIFRECREVKVLKFDTDKEEFPTAI